MSNIDLSQLTSPEVIESLDYETLLTARKARPISLYPVDKKPPSPLCWRSNQSPWCACGSKPAIESGCCVRATPIKAAPDAGLCRRQNLDHIGVTYYQEARLMINEADLVAVPPVAAEVESDD